MHGELEKRGSNMQISDFLLRTLAICGVMAVVAIAPNAVGALKKIDPTWESKIDPRKRISQTLYRLKKRGLVTVSGRGMQRNISLTKKGASLVNAINETKFHVRKPLRWDGRWRMVIFDIPEHRRATRDMFRRLIKKIGFIRVQGSVWIYPYNCEEVVALIKTDQHLGKQVVYAIVDVLESDASFRKHFKLRES